MRYDDFVHGITEAYRHHGGTKTLRLGKLEAGWFRKIQSECAWVIESAGSSDVTARDHVTYWTRPSGQVRQFSLFNSSGQPADTKGDYGYLGDVKQKKLVFPQLEALTRFAALFQPALRNLRLNGMGLKSALNAHEEGSIHVAGLRRHYIVRLHLPIFSNPDARMYLDDEYFHYDEGNLYFFNHGCVHAAANDGAGPRYHLVFDCFLDRALFKRIFPGHPSPDVGLEKCSESEARMSGEPFHFPDFACESGKLISGAIDYGRRVPGRLDQVRRNYPSAFRIIGGALDNG